MQILIIPDIHLKPWIYDDAEIVLKQHPEVENIVTLGDIPDDFGHKNDIPLYEDTFNRAEQFYKDHPDSLWCIGNHEASYLWDQWTNGMAYRAKNTAYHKIKELYDMIPESQLAFIHRIDDVVFSHAGIEKRYVDAMCRNTGDDTDAVITQINNFGCSQMWNDHSPIWFRPQMGYEYGIDFPTFQEDKLFYVVGHTPMQDVTLVKNVLSCDVFSTYRDGRPFGSQKFVIIDTKTHVYTTTLAPTGGNHVSI